MALPALNSKSPAWLTSDFSTPREMYVHQDSQEDFLSTALPPSPRPEIHSPELPFFNKPPPRAASETPITLDDAIRKMNHHLLRSCALLAQKDLDKALSEADYALYLAEARKVFHLQCKSQLYRGLCLMQLMRWEEASAAFTRAANVRGWGTRVAELKIEAERMMNDAEQARRRAGK